ncbi:MAG TPA: YHS domain-containing protein [Fimbriimonadaceae bacterium]|nr:YHS domain-containing protein [Fimbriimonadaceae bacterium]
MFATLIATIALGLAPAQDAKPQPLACAVMGSPVSAKSTALDYAGVRYSFCCPGCDKAFEKDPQAAIKSPDVKGKVIGVSLFDPVSGLRIKPKKDTLWSDYEGVRYHFASDENKKAFDADAKTFAKAPEKEALYCAVMDHAVASYEAAGGYVDHEGVRYYICCAACMGKMKGDAGKYAAGAAKAVKKPATLAVKKA